MSRLLLDGLVLIHPWMIGELAVGSFRGRASVLRDLSNLDRATVASDAETLHFIESHGLSGTSLGHIDVGLLASAVLTPHASLWTRDRKLFDAADRMGIAAEPAR